MLCERCHKNTANVRYAEVVEGEVKEMQLCRDCLAQQQTESVSGFNLGVNVPSPHRPHWRPDVSGADEVEVCCANCGMEVNDVLRTGQVGCSNCYRLFADEIEPVLEGLQLGMLHHGRSPGHHDSREALSNLLQAKRALLRSAVSTEDFESAATLRDEIKELEAKLLAAGGTPPPSKMTLSKDIVRGEG